MFYFGADYYPEQWPEERWTEDGRLMAEAGFNIVRLAEFAWATMEPEAGRFDFAWLDRAIALLAERGMKVILGTPTASPPPWLMAGRPELFRVRHDGQRVTFGNRREYCPNHPDYHEATRRIVSRHGRRTMPTIRRSSPGRSTTSSATAATAPPASLPSRRGCASATTRWTR